MVNVWGGERLGGERLTIDDGNNDDDDGGNDDDDGGGGDACGDYDVLTEVALAPITTPVTSYFNFFLVFIKTT